jgi:hypothetical protein
LLIPPANSAEPRSFLGNLKEMPESFCNFGTLLSSAPTKEMADCFFCDHPMKCKITSANSRNISAAFVKLGGFLHPFATSAMGRRFRSTYAMPEKCRNCAATFVICTNSQNDYASSAVDMKF